MNILLIAVKLLYFRVAIDPDSQAWTIAGEHQNFVGHPGHMYAELHLSRIQAKTM